jgi:hypothetical protein
MALLLAGCQQFNAAEPTTDYGYVQFQLVKALPADGLAESRATLDWLADASKVSVMMQSESGATITQTLPINYSHSRSYSEVYLTNTT